MTDSRKMSEQRTSESKHTSHDLPHEQDLITPQDSLSALFKNDAAIFRSPQIIQLQRVIGNRATTHLVTGRVASGDQLHVQRDFLYYDRLTGQIKELSGSPPRHLIPRIVDGQKVWTTPSEHSEGQEKKRDRKSKKKEKRPKRQDRKKDTHARILSEIIALAKESLSTCIGEMGQLLKTIDENMSRADKYALLPPDTNLTNVCKAAQLTLNADLGKNIVEGKVFLTLDDYNCLFTVRRILQKMQSFLDDEQMVKNIIPFKADEWQPGSHLQGETRFRNSKFPSRPKMGQFDPGTKEFRDDLINTISPAEFSEVIDEDKEPLHPEAQIKLPLVEEVEGDTIEVNTTTLLHELAHAAAELFDAFPVVSDRLFSWHAQFAKRPQLAIRDAESVAMFIRTLIRLMAGNDAV